MRERPSPEEFLAVFDGRIYRPVGDDVAIERGGGWGRSGDRLTHLSLQFAVGRARHRVTIDVSKDSRNVPVTALQELLFGLTAPRLPRFPIAIERGRQLVPVEGRRRSFTTYGAGRLVVATARTGDVDVTIHCPRTLLPSLALERIESADLECAGRRPTAVRRRYR